jgi:hypothetical protein
MPGKLSGCISCHSILYIYNWFYRYMHAFSLLIVQSFDHQEYSKGIYHGMLSRKS